MAAKLIALLCAVCIAAAQGGVVRRDAPAPAAAPVNHFEEISKGANQFASTFSEQFGTLVNAKSTDEVNKAFRDGSSALLAQVQQLSTTLGKAFGEANGQAKVAIGEAVTKLDQTAKELRAQNPQVEEQTKVIGEKIKAGVQSTLDETKRLATQLASQAQVAGDKFAPTLKKGFEDFIKGAEDVRVKIHEAAQKA